MYIGMSMRHISYYAANYYILSSHIITTLCPAELIRSILPYDQVMQWVGLHNRSGCSSRRQYGTILAGWRCMDRHQKGYLCYAEFCQSCREMLFNGDLRSLWRELDVKQKGIITFKERWNRKPFFAKSAYANVSNDARRFARKSLHKCAAWRRRGPQWRFLKHHLPALTNAGHAETERQHVMPSSLLPLCVVETLTVSLPLFQRCSKCLACEGWRAGGKLWIENGRVLPDTQWLPKNFQQWQSQLWCLSLVSGHWRRVCRWHSPPPDT